MQAMPLVGSIYMPRRILLVEDNPDGRASLLDLLTLLGHSVTAAADGEAGLRMGLETRPEVAIIDINLPKMDGCQVAEHLRWALGDAVTLIAYTACNEREAGRRRDAFNDWVIKPVEVSELLSCLKAKGMGRA
jgi:two-component system, sensor histidine kinase